MPGADNLVGGPIRVDPVNACVWRGAEALRLTPKAFAVLQYLVARAGQLVTKEALLQAIWPETTVSETALTVCIGELRKALGETARGPRYIATVHRRGYRFIGPCTPGGAPGALPLTPPLPVARPPLFIGREAALQRLHAWFAQAQDGLRQVVFITGEAGIGKTALVDTFLARLTAAAPLWLARGQCIAHYGAGEAYLPVLDALGRLCRARTPWPRRR